MENRVIELLKAQYEFQHAVEAKKLEVFDDLVNTGERHTNPDSAGKRIDALVKQHCQKLKGATKASYRCVLKLGGIKPKVVVFGGVKTAEGGCHLLWLQNFHTKIIYTIREQS